jgi:hypothetical protein
MVYKHLTFLDVVFSCQRQVDCVAEVFQLVLLIALLRLLGQPRSDPVTVGPIPRGGDKP